MTYFRALAEQYGSWRSQALLYLAAFITATAMAVGLEIGARVTLVEILVMTVVCTAVVMFGVPALHLVFLSRLSGNNEHLDTQRDARTTPDATTVVEQKDLGQGNSYQRQLAQEYYSYVRQLDHVTAELSRLDIAPQTKMILLRLLYVLIERAKTPSSVERGEMDFYTDQARYETLIPLYRELEEIFLAIGIKSYGRMAERITQQEPVQEQSER